MLMLDDDACRELLQLLWRQSITGLALVSENGAFVRANPAFCRMLEYTEAELRTKTFQEITDPADLVADTEMAKLVAEGQYESYDITKGYITKTKKHQPVLLRVTSLRMNGKFIFFVGEAAPLDKPVECAPPPEGMEARVKRNLFLKFIKDYWAQILFAIGVCAAIAERVK